MRTTGPSKWQAAEAAPKRLPAEGAAELARLPASLDRAFKGEL